MIPSAHQAVALGLLRIAPPDALFPGRDGGPAMPALADVRGALSDIPLRELILEGLATSLIDNFPTAEVFVGLARAGVPWAAMLADRMRRPAAVVNLDGPRASGLQRRIEGVVAHRRVVLVDNLISSGKSLRKAGDIVTDAGGAVVGALTVITDAVIATSAAPLEFAVQSLWSLRELAEAAFDIGRIDGETHRRLVQ